MFTSGLPLKLGGMDGLSYETCRHCFSCAPDMLNNFAASFDDKELLFLDQLLSCQPVFCPSSLVSLQDFAIQLWSGMNSYPSNSHALSHWPSIWTQLWGSSEVPLQMEYLIFNSCRWWCVKLSLGHTEGVTENAEIFASLHVKGSIHQILCLQQWYNNDHCNNSNNNSNLFYLCILSSVCKREVVLPWQLQM